MLNNGNGKKFVQTQKIWKAPLLNFVFFISLSFRFTNSGHVVWDTLHCNYLRNIEYTVLVLFYQIRQK